MTVKELILANRSFRRFDESIPVGREELVEMVDCARCSASAANRQPLKYILAWTKDMNERIFPTLAWAAYLKDWKGPAKGERPSGYIIILNDKRIHPQAGIDPGIACQSILLKAVEDGLGGCIIATVKKQELAAALHIPQYLDILVVIAVGKPVETVVLEEVKEDGDIKYYRDEQGVHHVPKRKLSDIIVEFG
ncbi:MAG TPA: nitroreductase family protein [Spirochaetia bacterium]|jgi:nitroreductase|nr:nitroreductase family protein [Spirochaetia bacterium]